MNLYCAANAGPGLRASHGVGRRPVAADQQAAQCYLSTAPPPPLWAPHRHLHSWKYLIVRLFCEAGGRPGGMPDSPTTLQDITVTAPRPHPGHRPSPKTVLIPPDGSPGARRAGGQPARWRSLPVVEAMDAQPDTGLPDPDGSRPRCPTPAAWKKRRCFSAGHAGRRTRAEIRRSRAAPGELAERAVRTAPPPAMWPGSMPTATTPKNCLQPARHGQHPLARLLLAGTPMPCASGVVLALSGNLCGFRAGVDSAWRQFALANYLDILQTHAFGNYRQLLEALTLSLGHGLLLPTYRGNARPTPRRAASPTKTTPRVDAAFHHRPGALNDDGSPVLRGGESP